MLLTATLQVTLLTSDCFTFVSEIFLNHANLLTHISYVISIQGSRNWRTKSFSSTRTARQSVAVRSWSSDHRLSIALRRSEAITYQVLQFIWIVGNKQECAGHRLCLAWLMHRYGLCSLVAYWISYDCWDNSPVQCPRTQHMPLEANKHLTCFKNKFIIWIMPSFETWCRVALVRTDVSEGRIASIIKVEIIVELRTLAACFSWWLLLTLFLGRWFFPN
jgi:hypothetical protein